MESPAAGEGDFASQGKAARGRNFAAVPGPSSKDESGCYHASRSATSAASSAGRVRQSRLFLLHLFTGPSYRVLPRSCRPRRVEVLLVCIFISESNGEISRSYCRCMLNLGTALRPEQKIGPTPGIRAIPRHLIMYWCSAAFFTPGCYPMSRTQNRASIYGEHPIHCSLVLRESLSLIIR